MATVDSSVGIVEFALWKISKRASARAQNKDTYAITWVQATIRLVLHLAGFAGLTVGAFTLHIAAGYIVGGLSCFALSRLMTTPAETNADSPQQTQRR